MPEFDLVQSLGYLGKLFAAYLLALPIAWDREVSTKSAGLRTYPLVAVGSCGFLLVGHAELSSDPTMNAHLMKGLIGGLGFLGGGAILKNSHHVAGMATAASIWVTGAVGMAVAYGRFEIAAVLSLATLVSLRLGKSMKRVAPHPDEPEEAKETEKADGAGQ